MRSLFTHDLSRPISNTATCLHNNSFIMNKLPVNIRKSYVNYAVFRLSGNCSVSPSIVRLASSKISPLWSRKYRTTSALANCATASCHSAFAAFNRFDPRSSETISKSPSVVSEHENSHLSDGRAGSAIAGSPSIFWGVSRGARNMFLFRKLVNTGLWKSQNVIES